MAPCSPTYSGASGAFWWTTYCLHGTAPHYLQDVIQPVVEVTSRHRLRSASYSAALVVPATRRSSLGNRAFAVARPRAWNSLPESVTDCSSPLTFKKYLKTYFFSYLFRGHDCVKRPWSSLGRLRRYNFVKLHYISNITFTLQTVRASTAWQSYVVPLKENALSV